MDLHKLKPDISTLRLLRGRWRQHPIYQRCEGNWLLNEGGGGINYDLSGYGHHCTISGGTTPTVGHSGRARAFDGVDGVSEKTGVLAMGDGSTDSPFTLSLSFMRRGGNRVAAGRYIGSGNLEYRCLIDLSSVYFNLYDESSNGYIGRTSSASSITSDVWWRITFLYDGSGAAAGCRFFLNETRLDSSDFSGGSYTAMENIAGNAFRIGRVQNFYSDAIISDVWVWRRVLSLKEISTLTHDPYLPFRWAYERRIRTFSLPAALAAGPKVGSLASQGVGL